MKKTLLIIAGSALVTGVAIKAAPAHSQTLPVDTNVSVVRTADLNLASNAGQQALDRRLVIAAGEVCGEASDSDLKGQNDVRQCRNDVLAAARSKARTIVAAKSGDTIAIATRN